MDFADTPEHAAFRREFRAWLEANLTDDLKVEDAQDQRVSPDRETLEKRIAWQKKMHAAGWVGISWPKEYGGRGASFMQQVIFDEEYFRARAPILPGTVGMSLLGPTLIHWGTEEQKKRYLPKILSAATRSGARAIPSRAPAPTSPACAPARSTKATISWSTARRCGPRARISPIGVFCWCAPTRRRRSTTASPICSSI